MHGSSLSYPSRLAVSTKPVPFSSFVVITTISAGIICAEAGGGGFMLNKLALSACLPTYLFAVDFDDIADLHILPHNRREALVVEDGRLLIVDEIVIAVTFLWGK